MNQRLTKIEQFKLSVKAWRNFLSNFMVEKVMLNATWICGLLTCAVNDRTDFTSVKRHSIFIKIINFCSSELKWICICQDLIL